MSNTAAFRPDIQGLRAIAVLLVLVFHIYPQTLPGGYVGVDVFFVISGFLISGLLMRESREAGTIKLAAFYERRFRRLVPAATVVICASTAGTILLLPQTRWADTGWQLLASAFYVENWYLYFQAVDYLRSDLPPGPFQHFWSLSVEEQFYFIWPLLILVTGVAAARLKLSARRVWGSVFTVVMLSSLAASVLITREDQPSAYFMLWTRIWELALGALAWLFVGRPNVPAPMRAVLSWAALAAIIASAVVFTETSSFPGYIALLPTMATALLLVLGRDAGAGSPMPLLRSSIMQDIGGISYSLYLWHWPVVVFGLAFLGKPFDFLQGLGVMGAAFALSAVTKVYVEDVFRSRKSGGSLVRVVGLFGLCSALSVGCALALLVPATQAVKDAAEQAIDYGGYPGAAALYADAPSPTPATGPAFIPDLMVARQSVPDMYGRNCHVPRPVREITPCVFEPEGGEGAPDYLVMLIGDSHAGQWLPAFQEIAKSRGWTIISHTKSSCPVIDADLIVGQTVYPECRDWGNLVVADVLARKPDLMVTAMITNHFVDGAKSAGQNQRMLADGLKRSWTPLAEAGIPIVAIAGTPRMTTSVPDCLAENPQSPDVCGRDTNEALGRDEAIQAASAEMSGQVRLIDMSEGICKQSFCPAVAGNIVVYRDENHLTVEYSRTLGALLSQKLEAGE
jgi:peptidoglycan/LPS O-acetylase OafA/YrhL